MKKDIHPKIYTDCVVTCACGNSFTTTSTLPNIHVEICSMCHPLFTGEAKFVDTEGRIQKFQKKLEKVQKVKSTKKSKKKVVEKTQEAPKTLKDLLKEEQNS